MGLPKGHRIHTSLPLPSDRPLVQSGAMKRKLSIITYVAIFGVILGLDLWTKSAVFDLLEASIHQVDGQPPQLVSGTDYVVVKNWFDLQAVLNYGAFNGWFAGARWMLVVISMVAVVGTFLMVAIPAACPRILVAALGLIGGGAIGNLYDRWQIGAVRDFVKWFYVDGSGKAWVWPNFNIADAAICVGVGLIVLAEILGALRRRKEAKAEPQAA